jgi:hypothetical protein
VARQLRLLRSQVGLLLLALLLPVPLVSLDGEGPHFFEGLGLALGRDRVLEVIGETFVVSVAQGPIVPARTDSIAVEAEVVPVYPLVGVHVEAYEAAFGLGFVIGRAKVCLDFGDEDVPVGCPFIQIGPSSCWGGRMEELVVVVVFVSGGREARLGSGRFEDFKLLLKPFEHIFGQV